MGYKNTDACLAKVADDEPIFVLRAQDATAHWYVELWAERAAFRLGNDHPKILEARKCAEAMRAWPKHKLPD